MTEFNDKHFENYEVRDLSPITRPYQEVKETIEIFLDNQAKFSFWFCDDGDNPMALIDSLKSDLKDHNPHELFLSGKWELAGSHDYAQDPWSNEIIPYANELSRTQIPQAVIILRTDQIPKDNIKQFLKELVRGIDSYVEHADGQKRYPIILVTPKYYLQLFLANTEETMPNWQGFRGRQDGINVLKRDS
ncbi:MAG: hypothetical protein AAB634_02250 [Patescibacteria group bacterium]